MGLARVQVQLIAESQFPSDINLIMNKALLTKLNIKSHPLRVLFGSNSDMGRIALKKISSNLILMRSTLASQLKMRNQTSIYAQFDPHTLHLRFGPFLGILINSEPGESEEQHFGQMTRFLEECAMSAHSLGIQVAVIHPSEVYVESKVMHGWIREKEHWIKTYLPLPDAIYNRIMSRKFEQQEHTQRTLSLLTNDYKIPIFNEQFLDKYQVHEILYNDAQVRSMLPETYPFQKKHIYEMLSKYDLLYLKPNNGSLGSGIIRVEKTPTSYLYQSPTTNGTISREVSSQSELTRLLLRRIGKQEYLIQQGLRLTQFEGRNVDFRVLVQKSRKGEWHVTSAVGRISNDQNIVSNLAQGGTVRKATDVLDELVHIPTKPNVANLRNSALEICKVFEIYAKGHYAELGIDLALDKKGKIWILEINSKPSKTDDTVTDPSLTIRPSVSRLMEYTFFISKFLQNTNKTLPISQAKTPFKPRRNTK